MHHINTIDGELCVVPSEDFTSQILKHFKISLTLFKKAFEVYRGAFQRLWTVKKRRDVPVTSRLIYDPDAKTITDPEFNLSLPCSDVKIYYDEFRYVTVNGFFSDLKLNELIKNYRPARKIGNELPPPGSTPYNPDVMEGVDLLELFPDGRDYIDFLFKFKDMIEDRETQPFDYKVEFPDGQVIYLLDRDGMVRYYSDIPNILKKELRMKIENRKNPVGQIVPHKDLFGTIVTKQLKGKELIRACNTNTVINAECNRDNFKLYRDRLLSEFGVDWNQETFGYPDARKVYMQMHTLYVKFGVDVTRRAVGINTTAKIPHIFRNNILNNGRLDPEVYYLTILPPYVKVKNWVPIKAFHIFAHWGKDMQPDATHSFLIKDDRIISSIPDRTLDNISRDVVKWFKEYRRDWSMPYFIPNIEKYGAFYFIQ